MANPSSSPSFLTFGFLPLSLFLLLSPAAGAARFLRLPSKPNPKDAAATARWLAGQNFWGVLSTISSDLEGAPFGNVVSFSDGLPDNGRGIPYFYLTELDPTAREAFKDARSSFTVSEYPLGTCGKTDPENPSCSKLTLTGKLKLVDNSSAEAEFAKNALFTKHPEMEGWPIGHNFKVFKLDIKNIFLIDWFGGPKPLTPEQYLKYGNTISTDFEGAPFGNVVSYSDGLPGNGSGVPYFYLTQLDPTAREALKDAKSSFTVSEYQLGTCEKTDPENPTCSKLTLTGELKLVNNSSGEAKFAKNALFTKHPEMKDWPNSHDFQIFKLNIKYIFLMDWFGGPKPLTPAQYFKFGKN